MDHANEDRAGKRVLVGFDGSDGGRAAVEDLTRAGLPDDAEAIVLGSADVPADPAFYSVAPVEGGGVITQAAIDAAREAVEREMRRAASFSSAGADLVAGLFPKWNVKCESTSGPAYWAIVERARNWRADLIVIGSHSRSAIARLFFGSVSQQVLSYAPCSVRVGRGAIGGARRPPGAAVRLLLAVDGSSDGAAAVDTVCSRNWPAGTEVRIVTVADSRLSLDLTFLLPVHDNNPNLSPVHRLVHSVGDRLRDSRLAVTTLILEGDPKSAIQREADHWGADCIFLGAQGHSRLERMLIGSVSAAVAARAPCSVEVARRQK